MYEVNLRWDQGHDDLLPATEVNSTDTYLVLYKIEICARYDISVRAYTKAGPGPYGQRSILETSSKYN